MPDECDFLPKVVGCAALLVIGALFIVIIVLPLSYHGLNYYEMGFPRQENTGKILVDKVYESGLHLLGPGYSFKIFPTDGQFISISGIKSFTADKLEVKLSATMQYFVRPYALRSLHAKFDLDYEDVLRKSAIDAVKGSLTVYNTREIVSKRKEIEGVVFKAVRERLGGVCCAPTYLCKTWKYACPVNCTKRNRCFEDDKGIFVDVKYFQLGRIVIPGTVEERFLQQLTLKEETEKEKLLQDAQVARKETQSMVQKIKNEAYEIIEEGEATSRLIQVTSAANYTSEVEGARSEGLIKLYNSLGITKQEHKNSFDFLRTLRGMDNIHLTVDYQQRIMGSLGGK